MLILYTLPSCPNCIQIKSKLKACGYEFEEQPMDTAENIAELRYNACFAMEAPVLRVGDSFYEYQHCMKEGFFSELLGMCDNKHEIPDFDEIHESTT